MSATSTHASISSWSAPPLLLSGANYWAHRFRLHQQFDASFDWSDSTIGFANADKPAPRRPVSDVCRPAAAACPAPQHNTTAGHTDKSIKVCVWRRGGLGVDVRCALSQGLLCGQTWLVHMQLLLTQHPFAAAAGRPLPRSEGHRTGRSAALTWSKPRPHIRRDLVRSARCGTFPPFIILISLTQHCFAPTACQKPGCSSRR